MSNPVRVLIVDDSVTMRRLIRVGIESDPDIRIIAEAGTAREARDMVKEHAPDVITLDIEMPGMDGLEFLSRLMRARPTPVIMVSSLTAEGSDATIQALSLGAIDCVEKPRFGTAGQTFSELAEKLKTAARANVARRSKTRATPIAGNLQSGWSWGGKTVLIGSSTGGVEALETILREFPENCPPTLITQHMPEQFLQSFAVRLNGNIAPRVQVARDGAPLETGSVWIAPGGATHLTLDRSGDATRLVEGPKRSGHRPSVDILLESAVAFAPRIVAAILTGMGRDGAEGMVALRRAGARCVGQDEASSVVYGMPRVAKELGGIDIEAPLQEIAGHLLTLTSNMKERVAQ